MEKQYHVLNGDALKEMLPDSIDGEVMVMRECLIDGDLKGGTFDQFFETRATFLSVNYGGSIQEYHKKVVEEFDKIRNIPEGSEVNLWFEDDLFCQVNFWFVVHFLFQHRTINRVYLIRPEKHDQYGFGGLSGAELQMVYRQKIELKQLESIANLWSLYQKEDAQGLLKVSLELETDYPFITAAVKAHIDRIPKGSDEGRPLRSLKAIIKELDTQDFGSIFREFNRRESIYGFGDVQVKKLLAQIKNT